MVYYCFTNVITYCTSICKATGFVMVVWNCRGKHPKSDGWLWLSSLKLRFLGMRYFQTNPTEGEMNSEHIPHRLVLPKISQIYVEKKLQTNFILPQISLFPLGSTTPVVAFPLHFIGPARICEDMPMIQALNCIFESVYPQKMINAFKYIYIYIFKSCSHSCALACGTHLLMVMKDPHGPPQWSDVNWMGKSPTTLRYPYHSPLDLILG